MYIASLLKSCQSPIVFFKLKNQITSVIYIMYTDSTYQHEIPFVSVITIMLLSVPHDYILLDYTIMVCFSGSITPQEIMSLTLKTYLTLFSKDVST